MAKKSRRTMTSRGRARRPSATPLRSLDARPIAEELEPRRLLAVVINEFGGSANLSFPTAITSGPDGNLWFTEQGEGAGIGRVTPSGAIVQYRLALNEIPAGIAPGPDGNLWFTQPGTSKIGRITTGGAITEFGTGLTPGSSPDQIVAGPDGALWFTERGANKIGRITTAGAITEHAIPTASSQPVGIAVGPDQALWFAEANADQIGRIDLSGQIQEFGRGFITPGGSPNGITAGPDGNLWFTEQKSSRIGRINPTTAAIAEFSAGITPNAQPTGITSGPDGRLWFTEQNADKVGAINTQGAVVEYPDTSGPDGNLWFTELDGFHVDRIGVDGSLTQFPSPTNALPATAAPLGITRGPDDALWFTENGSDQIGRIDLSGRITSFPAGTLPNSAPSGITLGPVPTGGGPANLWFTDPAVDRIDEITPSGVLVAEFGGLTSGSHPQGITLGPDGNLWFAESGTGGAFGGIGTITPTGTVTEFNTGLTSGAAPDQIATGPDGALYFTESLPRGGAIGRIVPPSVNNPSPTIQEQIIVPGTPSSPLGIAVGPDGRIWFADHGNRAIGVFTPGPFPTTTLAEFDLGPNGDANGIAAGPDGNLWFTETVGNQVGRITTSGTITTFAVPTPGAGGMGIVAGPDNNLWFAENRANQIGQVVLPRSIIGAVGVASGAVATVPTTFIAARFMDSSSATNAGNFSATVDFGDDTSGPAAIAPDPSSPGSYLVRATHTYSAIGTFTTQVTIGNDVGTIAPVRGTVNATTPLSIAATPVDGIIGRRANTQVATFADQDGTAQAGDFAATISWGDGTTSLGVVRRTAIVLGGASTFTISGDHTYLAAPTTPTSATIVDRRNSFTAAATATAPANVVAAPAFAAINEVVGTAPGSNPRGITLGPDGNLWFTEFSGGGIGRIGTDGTIAEYPGPIPPGNPGFDPATSRPVSIVAGPDGALWFTDEGTGNSAGAGGIGRITTSGVANLFTAGIAPGSQPEGIALGPDGNLWFTEAAGNTIGRITTAGVVTLFSTGLTAEYDPLSIVAGPDANLWFIGGGTSLIGRITTAGVITEFPGATGGGLTSITRGPGDALWFTEKASDRIGRIDPTTFRVTEYASGALNAPNFITAGPDGNLYFTEAGGTGSIGVITTAGIISGFHAGLTANSNLAGIAAGPDGNLYFSEGAGDRIGQVILPQSSVVPTPGNPVEVPGQPTTMQVASFFDLSSLANLTNFQATIDFGDGGPATAGSIAKIGSGFAVAGSHTYSAPGDHVGTVTIFNDAGSKSVTFTAKALTLAATGLVVSAIRGRPFTAAVATFVDSFGVRPAGAYAASIDWGDGTGPTPGVVSMQTGGGLDVVQVAGGHTYAATGNFRVTTTILVNARPSYSATATSTATVANPPPLSFVVTNTNDSGPGSLRQAILNADTTSGVTITFAIPGVGPVETIPPLAPLPAITSPGITIDGDSQAAFEGSAYASPLVEVDGRALAGTPAGFFFAATSAGSLIRGLSIFGFGGPLIDLESSDIVQGNYLGLRADGARAVVSPSPSGPADGVLVHGPGAIIGGLGPRLGNVISGNAGQGIDVVGPNTAFVGIFGNIIGLDPTGEAPRGNGFNGITVTGGTGLLFIGPGNLISANGAQGIAVVSSQGVVIQGNAIGTDATVTRAIGNAFDGILVDGRSSTIEIGGSAGGNIISGNGLVGIAIQGGSSGNRVSYNRIGTDSLGLAPIGNGIAGVLVSDSPANQVGPGNLISANGSALIGAGVWIDGPGSTGNRVFGNRIGTDLAGTRALGNNAIGVLVNEAAGNTIGGTAPGDTNVISGNTIVGVMLAGLGASGNLVEANLIGTDASGSRPLGDGPGRQGTGLYIENAPNNAIGGPSPSIGNVISGNGVQGVELFGPGATGNLLQGNKVGTDPSGTRPLGNGNDGLVVDEAPSNRFLGNVVAANEANGFTISGRGATGNVLKGNSIGVGSGGRPLGNRSFGILLVNGSSRTVESGNTVANNALGPARDTGLAPAGPTVTVPHPGGKKPKQKPRVKPKAISFGSRSMTRLQGLAKAKARSKP